ncbi:MAG: RIP metalloprotease RseP [Gammaproteobacteria bacterium]|nr:RIP metalloprotease RseP [Gammaproteobacteria bacterium]MCY4357636.1 RIP metalloprotease RseP [Gammaproteobacteria bacterium]
MLEILISIIALLVTLGILVTIHEFGHFWVARRCGVQVLRFSVGFGKAIFRWLGKDGVEYVIAPIPLGGYVKMLGQEDLDVAEETPESLRQYSFAYKPLWQRMAIVAAGPAANFLLAIVVFWIINLTWGVHGIAPVVNAVVDDSPAEMAGLATGDQILAVDGEDTFIWQQVLMQLFTRLGETGELVLTIDPVDSSVVREVSIPIEDWMGEETEPDLLSELGILRFDIPALIAEVVPGQPAEVSGLGPGDQIESVNGQEIHGWMHWVSVIRNNPDTSLEVQVSRDGQIRTLDLRPKVVQLEDGRVEGSIGAYVQSTSLLQSVPPEYRREVRYGPFMALGAAMQETWEKSVFVLDSVKKLIIGLISVKNINGPITIAQVAGQTATYGPEIYLGFLALLSISLGVMNLLPIPVLDGGHLLYYLIEAVIRRPVPPRIQAWGLQLGLLIIAGIMVLAFYNDVTRLL